MIYDVREMCSCDSVLEHCVSSAKGCGFNFQGTHVLTKKMDSLNKSLWIKASAKCINVNLNIKDYNYLLLQ